MAWIDELLADMERIPTEVVSKILVDDVMEQLQDEINRQSGGIR